MSTPTYRLLRETPPPPFVPDLDDAQGRVVTHPGGPLLVLAGPGTGKTTTLVEAVVNRVDRGLPPEQALVLTFSRKAADELRARITARLGRTVTEPSAWTFHSFCHALVRRYGTGPELEMPRLLSGPEREVRIRDLLWGNAAGEGITRWPDSVVPALRTRGLAEEVADLLDRARERGLDGSALAMLGEAWERPAWVAAGHFLDEYLEILDFREEIDYAGLVALAIGLLGQPEVLDDVRDRYRAVFVDEYQDTDPSQEALLTLLAGDGRDLVVVGDPDQSIYAFRGADVSCILAFPERFRTVDGHPAQQVALDVSRRFGETLLAPARLLAERIPTPGLNADVRRAHRGVAAVGPAGDPPSVLFYPTVAEEVQAVADLLRRAHLREGVPWGRMAVLVRSGVRSIPVLRRAFATAGVPVSVAADEVPVARDPAVQPLLYALRVADDIRAGRTPHLLPDEAEHLLLSPLGRALPSGLRLVGRRLRDLDRAAGAVLPRPSAELIRDAVLDPADLTTVDEWAAAPLQRLHTLFHAAAAALATGTPEDALWQLWDRSGWGRRLEEAAGGAGPAARQADRDLDAVLGLFQAAARLEERRPRGGVAALLDELAAQEIPGAPTEERAAAGDAVRLLTAHRAKGLEWDVVVVSGVQEGVWPDLRRRGSLLDADLVDLREPRPPVTTAALLAEERRLLYVALTRARRRLVVTAVESLDDSGDRPSRFLDELGIEPVRARAAAADGILSVESLVARLRRTLYDAAATDPTRAAAARRLAALGAAKGGDGAALVPAADPATWWGLRDVTEGAGPVRDPDQPLLLSGSALVAHQRCPLRWFLDREVGAQRPATAAQGFGLVLHALVRLVSDGVLAPDVGALLQRLDDVWPSLGFEARWHGDAERREAEAALTRFLAWHQSRPREVAGSEQEFRVQIGDVLLVGSADRVEIAGDGAVHVVDFKTGKTARRADDLANDPQLGVYQLVAREGAFAGVAGEGAAVGGAELVWLRNERKGGLPQVQRQEPLGDGETWVHVVAAGAAEAIRSERYAARPDDDCDRCPFRGCCPAHPAGGQVVE